jgi:hypothetical protein
MRRAGSIIAALVLGSLLVSHNSAAAPPQAGDTPAAKSTRGKWAPVFQQHASEYAITVVAPNGVQTAATMVPEPLLRWWQPVRGGDDGALYLWVVNGRPIAVQTFFTFRWKDNRMRALIHEHHSLAQEPLEATWHGRSTWRTPERGITFHPLDGAPAPASSAAARLRQMQALVRDFSAKTVDDKASTWTLRPLAKPLYRYEEKGPKVVDGALFAFAQGTDPEAFLLLEARVDGRDMRWHYAVTRFTDLQITISHGGREVYSGPRTIGGPDEVYQTTVAIERASDSPKDFEQP